MKIIKKIILSTLLTSCLCLCSYVKATELPDHVVSEIKKAFPKAIIRFDGLIELSDGVRYLPVIPLYSAETRTPEKLSVTIPENSTIDQKPDFMLFEDNFALFKINKASDGNPSIIHSAKIPLVVKMGLIPQDLVVPEKLEIPYDLKVILGDLKIPLKKEETGALVYSTNAPTNNKKNIVKSGSVSKEKDVFYGLGGKVFYTSNIQSNRLFKIQPGTGRVVKSFQLPSVYNSSIQTKEGRYILITCLNTNKIGVFDTYRDAYIKDLVLDNPITNIMPLNSSDIAFAYNDYSKQISVLDLKEMSFKYNIETTFPISNMVAAENDKFVYFNDKISGNIYRFDLNELKTKLVGNVPNISKLVSFKNYLLVTSRKNNKFYVYDVSEANFLVDKDKVAKEYQKQKKLINENTLVNFIKRRNLPKLQPEIVPVKDENSLAILDKVLEVGEKPLDIKISKDKNKIYVLCANSNQIHIFDSNTFSPTGVINLGEGKFPKEIVYLDKINRALIVNYDSFETTVVDLEKESVVGYIPSGIVINTLFIKTPTKM